MKPDDFVYNQVYKGLLNAGVSQLTAQQQAVIALEKYKKSSHGARSAGDFIKKQIQQGKKLAPKKGR